VKTYVAHSGAARFEIESPFAVTHAVVVTTVMGCVEVPTLLNWCPNMLEAIKDSRRALRADHKHIRIVPVVEKGEPGVIARINLARLELHPDLILDIGPTDEKLELDSQSKRFLRGFDGDPGSGVAATPLPC